MRATVDFARNLLLQAHQAVEALLRHIFGHLIGHGGRGRAFLGGIGERAEPVEPRFLNEVEHALEIVLRLRREADDHRRAQR